MQNTRPQALLGPLIKKKSACEFFFDGGIWFIKEILNKIGKLDRMIVIQPESGMQRQS